VHRDGRTQKVEALEPQWLDVSSGVTVWADIRTPDASDAAVLRDVFKINDLAVSHALEAIQYPKVESYGSYIYVVLHGIDFKPQEHAFETQDVDFLLARNFLATVHDGRRRSIDEIAEMCGESHFVLADGPVGLMHRIVDTMVAHYRPEVDELEEWLDDIETRVLERRPGQLTSEILGVKRDISAMRRIVIPQRDVVGRLARREFDMIGQEHAYRFRDVYDHLVQIGDETIIFQDRVSGILDAHLASTSNQLALVSRVLAGIAVIFGPLTVITGLFGMNVELPEMPGGPAAQFWWIIGVMTAVTGSLYWAFRRKGWL
jgi:magnesium transporter